MPLNFHCGVVAASVLAKCFKGALKKLRFNASHQTDTNPNSGDAIGPFALSIILARVQEALNQGKFMHGDPFSEAIFVALDYSAWKKSSCGARGIIW